MGTTTLAICVALVLFLIRAAYRHGLLFVRAHVKQTLGEGALWAVSAWLLLFAFNIIKTVYNDHQQLVRQLQQMKVAAATAAKPIPPKLVGLGWSCEMSGVPTKTPPHSELWLLPLSANGASAIEGLLSGFIVNENPGGMPIPAINHGWLKELKTQGEQLSSLGTLSSRRCDIRNSGRDVFSNVQIVFEFEFRTNGTKGRINDDTCSRPYAVIIPEIDPGKPFVFYAVNQTAAWANFAFPAVATLELPDSTRQTVSLRQVGARPDAFNFLWPTQIHWNGRAPEDEQACKNLYKG